MQKVSIFNYSFQNNSGSKTCDVYIDGAIVDADTKQWYSMWYEDNSLSSFKSVRDQINKAITEGANTVNVHVNSQGGSVVEAFAIKDYLDQLSNKGITVTKQCTGMSASSATLIVSGKGSSISQNSWFMIHNCSGGIYGTVTEIENYAVTIRKFNDQILDHYETVTGLGRTTLEPMMNNETWLTGKDAVALGFVESLSDSDSTETSINNLIKPENWMHQNKKVLAAYNSTVQTIPPIQNFNTMDIKSITASIKEAFMNSLKEAGLIKDEHAKHLDSLTASLDKALEPMNQGITDLVTELVTNQIKDIDTTIANKVKEAIEAAAKDAITMTAIEDKLKPITDSIADIENKLLDGGESAKPKEDGSSPKNILNHPGVSFG